MVSARGVPFIKQFATPEARYLKPVHMNVVSSVYLPTYNQQHLLVYDAAN